MHREGLRQNALRLARQQLHAFNTLASFISGRIDSKSPAWVDSSHCWFLLACTLALMD